MTERSIDHTTVETAKNATPAVDSTKRSSGFAFVATVAEKYALLGLLLLLVLFFSTNSTTGDFFLTSANLQNIFANQAVTGLIAIGMVVPMIAGYFDLSVPAAAGLSNVVVAALLCTHHAPIWLALVCGIAAGLVVGIINGVMAAVLRLNALIATLGVYILLGGLLLAYTNGRTINTGFPQQLGQWGAGQWLGLARPFWLLLLGAVVIWYVVQLTPFGRRLAAIGSNETAAKLAGINVRRSVMISFVLAATLGGVAGVILTIRTGAGDATTGTSYLFPAIAAVFLGQTAISPGRPNVWGTVIAVFLVAVAVNGLTLLGAQFWVQQVFNGAALLVALILSALIVRVRERRAGRALLMSVIAGSDEPPAGSNH